MYKKIITISILLMFLTSCKSISGENVMTTSPIEVTNDTTDTEPIIKETEKLLTIETVIKEINETDSVLPPTEIITYDALFPICIDGYMEYMDINGNVVSDYKFDKAMPIYDGMGIVMKDGLAGAIDLTGKISVPLQYTYIENFSCGLAVATNEKGEKGYINKNNEVVIQFKEYSMARSFSEDIAIICDESMLLCEFYNTEGELIGSAGSSGVSNWGDFDSGLMLNSNRYYDVNGNIIIEDGSKVGKYPAQFSEGFAVIPFLKEEASAFCNEENWNEVYYNGKNWNYKYIDTTGADAFDKIFEAAGSFSEGLAVVESDGKRGCINTNGDIVFYHDYIDLFNQYQYLEGCIPFYYKNQDGIYKYGFLDNNGNEVIPSDYYYVYYGGFHDGLALVAENEERTQLSYINKNNEKIYSFTKPDGVALDDL